MSARALMFMGTGSDVGKSLIVAGLCRAYVRRGLKVAPFKPQNMSNNAAVASDNGEIGRAQALQAKAAKIAPTTAMNPILLKPEHESGAQVIVRGKRAATLSAAQYFSLRQKYMPAVLDAFGAVCDDADLVLVEGAGSASEVNLRHNDIANFGFAQAANIGVVLIGDIQRGGVIASLVGTFCVIDEADANMVVATLINRFQGDTALFDEGKSRIAEQTKRPCLGPVAHFEQAHLLPAEDILGLKSTATSEIKSEILIAIPKLPRMANFDDFDPLLMNAGVVVIFVEPGVPMPANASLIIIPGSKSTRADLEFLIDQGWDIDIKAHVRRGGKVLGICAGFQMLGQTISDPEGIEGNKGTSQGLGLLDIDTIMDPSKRLQLEDARDDKHGCPLKGYHMHLGRTEGPDCQRPFSWQGDVPQGAVSKNGNVMGTYLHGLFSADEFRTKFLGDLAKSPLDLFNYDAKIEQILDALADHLEAHLDLEQILNFAKTPVFERAKYPAKQ